MSYTDHRGSRHYSREDYEKALGLPDYGPDFLAGIYGPVSRFFIHDAAEKIDGWLQRLDEKAEAAQEPAANSHLTTPPAVFLSGLARGLRHAMRGRTKPLLAMAAGTALVIGVASALGAGLLAGGLAALVALPLSTGIGGFGLHCALALPRVVMEAGRAICNIPVGYSRRKTFFTLQQYDRERDEAEEKRGLGPLCRAVFDDEKQAEKAAPADRANWIYGLAKHFPEEFLEAAKKNDSRAAVPATPRPAITLKNLPD